jgi:Glutathione S-transferase, N-terminal domain
VPAMIRIHNFARGGRGLRVIWQCEEMALPYRLETLSFPTSEAYRALNPLGTVPFLEDVGGVAINESSPSCSMSRRDTARRRCCPPSTIRATRACCR